MQAAATRSLPVDVRVMNALTALLMGAFALLVVVASLRWGLRHPVFAIDAIEIRGELRHTNGLTLRANVAPQLQGTFFTIDLARARTAFEAVPWVRHAVVRRQFPNRLSVSIEEHQPVAFWNEPEGVAMVNSHGEVFEANTGDVEDDGLPVLAGPAAESAQLLALYRELSTQYERVDLGLVRLDLTARGTWRAQLDTGATIELGRGSVTDVSARNQMFLRTATQVASGFQRRLDSIESADLRHVQGYAIKLRGVSTLVPGPSEPAAAAPSGVTAARTP